MSSRAYRWAPVLAVGAILGTRCTLSPLPDSADGVNGAKGADAEIPSNFQKGNDAACGASVPALSPGGSWPEDGACGSLGGSAGPAQKGKDGFSGSAGDPRMNVMATQPSDLENGGAKVLRAKMVAQVRQVTPETSASRSPTIRHSLRSVFILHLQRVAAPMVSRDRVEAEEGRATR